MSLFGAERQIYSHKSTAASIVNQASSSTIPIGETAQLFACSSHCIVFILGIDDIKSAKKLEELAVEFFNGFTCKTVQGGEARPKTGLIVTSNCPFAENQRYL